MQTHRDRRVTPHGGKSGPPLRGRSQKPAGGVGLLARSPATRCAALLAGGLLRAITIIAGIEYGP